MKQKVLVLGLIAAAAVVGGYALKDSTYIATALGSDCDNPAACDRKGTETQLTQQQQEAVVGFVVERLLSGGSVPSAQEIADATGLSVSKEDVPSLQQAVMAALSCDPKGKGILSSNRCAEYEACSYTKILSTATGEQLEMYVREKAEDGRVYHDFQLPTFEARDLSGREVSSKDLVGRPTVLVLLAQHCGHSVDSLPILSSLAREYGPKGYRVVGVMVNSGTVEDVKTWFEDQYRLLRQDFEQEYEVWVASDMSAGDAIGSHLTPTYLLVDDSGLVHKKLVGYKSQQVIEEQIRALASDWKQANVG